MLKVVGNAVELVPANNPQLSLKIEAEIIGQPPAVVPALNKFILLRILNQGYDKIKANGHGFAPVMAEGGMGQFIAMPVRINSELNTTTRPVNEKVNKMEEKKNVEVEPLDELNASVEALRMSLKQLYDVSVVLNRKVKEASFARKQKGREYVQAKRAIERIRAAV
ncbi:MAG: hypothetical protein PHI85_09480 [Victivallaceae bacterium]|nr:hypothetical protein [Victivallaceae bacterium]